MTDELTRQELLEALADRILAVERPHTVRVGVDGIDLAGKTTLADEMAAHIERRGRPVIRASIDGFHRPRVERYRRGEDSPEGYYQDSFDYDSVREELLEQLSPGGTGRYRAATFDLDSDVFIYEPLRDASSGSILLFDGIFLFRPELNDFWDFRIFLHIGFDEMLRRARLRDTARFGTPEAVEQRYRTRYIPGQQLYLQSVEPEKLADVVVDNNDVARPRVV